MLTTIREEIQSVFERDPAGAQCDRDPFVLSRRPRRVGDTAWRTGYGPTTISCWGAGFRN